MSVYAEVIGDPVAHSRSPAIHTAWLRALGLPGDFRAVRVPAGAIAGHLAERSTDPLWRGCSVTLPHKEAVLACLGRVDPGHTQALGHDQPVGADSPRQLGHDGLGCG